jgi:hypothetical protein
MSRSPRKGMRERWLPYVYAADIDGSTRSLLLTLYLLMTPAGHVSVPRGDLAELFGVHPDLVSQWVARAVKAGLLSKRGGGYPGRVAEYEAILPTANGCVRTQPFGSTINRVFRARWLCQDSTHRARVTNASRERTDHESNAGDAPPALDTPDRSIVLRSLDTARSSAVSRAPAALSGSPNGTAPAAVATDIANTQPALTRQTAERDVRPTENSNHPPRNPPSNPTTDSTSPDAPTPEELDADQLARDLDAKHEARLAQLHYQRTGRIQ